MTLRKSGMLEVVGRVVRGHPSTTSNFTQVLAQSPQSRQGSSWKLFLDGPIVGIAGSERASLPLVRVVLDESDFTQAASTGDEGTTIWPEHDGLLLSQHRLARQFQAIPFLREGRHLHELRPFFGLENSREIDDRSPNQF